MRFQLIKTILTLIFINFAECEANYYGITNEGVIHSLKSVSQDVWVRGHDNQTVALMIYENNVNKTGYLFNHFLKIIIFIIV